MFFEFAYAKSTNYSMDKFSFLNAAHTGFIADLYDQYLQNPDAVEPSWRSFFQGYDFANENYSLKDAKVQIPDNVFKEFKGALTFLYCPPPPRIKGC